MKNNAFTRRKSDFKLPVRLVLLPMREETPPLRTFSTLSTKEILALIIYGKFFPSWILRTKSQFSFPGQIHGNLNSTYSV